MKTCFIRNGGPISLALGVLCLVGSHQPLHSQADVKGNVQTEIVKVDYDFVDRSYKGSISNLTEGNAFADAPENFKGKIIRIACYPFGGFDSLREARGKVVEFGPTSQISSPNIFIKIPQTLDVPNIKSYVYVTFKCSQGSFNTGNVAIKIERPQ